MCLFLIRKVGMCLILIRKVGMCLFIIRKVGMCLLLIKKVGMCLFVQVVVYLVIAVDMYLSSSVERRIWRGLPLYLRDWRQGRLRHNACRAVWWY